ncbi:GTP cyclohydrolase II RibA [Coralloluteibacterium stylophorae]|uniref:GTP cyclohydrolase-2 n=1 Tax=Coralloluteibacterium stylophorae TaxID=1776034 RepID=A0A8J8AYA9_9GAMM|nr:GTP cyclohydrolase II RibA [Coralloluteibacterium stylophorae]MBS7456256.1 GTP cyclohydrolase II RibA [Coralloluteibacterium stylophorae]
MPSSPQPGHASAFGNAAAIRCERAASEMRSGRPVLIDDGHGRRIAALALDGATAATYAAFAQAAGGSQQLFLTPTRAAVFGVDAPEGALVTLGGMDFDAINRLGYLRDAPAPAAWEAGGTLHVAAVRVARLGLLLPAIVVADVVPENPAFDGCGTLTLEDLQEGEDTAARDFELVTRSPVPLRDIGMTQFAVFRGGLAQRDQVAVIVGCPDLDDVVPVRVHSSCLTGDLFGSLKCDCGDQLRHGLKALKERGGGVLLYLDQEGRGTGIAAKMRAYGYQHDGLDTIDADAQLGFGSDERRYETAVAMLRGLGVRRVELLTNNPAKVMHLRSAGLDVVRRTPVTGEITAENEGYLRTKAARAGHMLDIDALIARS